MGDRSFVSKLCSVGNSYGCSAEGTLVFRDGGAKRDCGTGSPEISDPWKVVLRNGHNRSLQKKELSAPEGQIALFCVLMSWGKVFFAHFIG